MLTPELLRRFSFLAMVFLTVSGGASQVFAQTTGQEAAGPVIEMDEPGDPPTPALVPTPVPVPGEQAVSERMPPAAEGSSELIPLIPELPAEEQGPAPIPDEDLQFLTGEEAVPEPSAEQLVLPSESSPQAELGVNKQPEASQGAAGADETDIPSLETEGQSEENLFFDAESLVPAGEMGTKSGPRKVDPRLQPASKLIVVKKNFEPETKEAGLVAAERAAKLGRYDAALEMYNRLYQKDKRNANVIMGRALALQNLGRDEEAIMAYEEILKTHPDNINAQVNMLGLTGRRYPAVALQRLMKLYEEAPDNVGVVAQIAVVEAALGQSNEALQYLGIAASMEPNNAGHLFNIAVIADRAGNKKEAVKYYEKALEVDSIYGGGRSIPRDTVFERLARLR